jgi:hypothetical protein
MAGNTQSRAIWQISTLARPRFPIQSSRETRRFDIYISRGYFPSYFRILSPFFHPIDVLLPMRTTCCEYREFRHGVFSNSRIRNLIAHKRIYYHQRRHTISISPCSFTSRIHWWVLPLLFRIWECMEAMPVIVHTCIVYCTVLLGLAGRGCFINE